MKWFWSSSFSIQSVLRVSNALWRVREGRAVEAMGVMAARQTDVFVLIGLNDITSGKKVTSDVVGGVCAIVEELMRGLRSEQTVVRLLELPMLPMFTDGMREEAENINALLKHLSTEAGFRIHGWDQRLLSVDGTVMPQWLIRGSAGIHLNGSGYDVFARHLRSIIISESINGRVTFVKAAKKA